MTSAVIASATVSLLLLGRQLQPEVFSHGLLLHCFCVEASVAANNKKKKHHQSQMTALDQGSEQSSGMSVGINVSSSQSGRHDLPAVQLTALQSRLKAEADRGAEGMNQARSEFEERISAMRVQLQQQEVDNAALLDVVQVQHEHYLTA